jgi:hypothetical protein
MARPASAFRLADADMVFLDGAGAMLRDGNTRRPTMAEKPFTLSEPFMRDGRIKRTMTLADAEP